MKRYLESQIIQDLKEKMVFIGGPRQVGKTKISQQVAQAHFNRHEYFNWDVFQDQKRIIDYSFSPDPELLIFDEVHKYKNWKNHIKGIYDSRHEKHHIMVNGSARLDLYRKGGDSMMGRYHYHRLHPISLAEAAELSDSFEIDLFERNYRLKFRAPQNKLLSDLIQKREVDFVVVIDGKPVIAIEVKMKTQKISTPMKYFIRKLKIPFGFQVVFETGIDFQSKTDNIRVISTDKFLTALV